MLKKLDELMKKYHINIRHIINVSDNEYEDVYNEAYIVLYSNYDRIMKDENVFINELRKVCLKFNKYSRRIESHRDFDRYNKYESIMIDSFDECTYIDEDLLVSIIDIKNSITDDEYSFLLYYYQNGQDECSKKYNITISNTRKRVNKIKNKIRGVLCDYG